MLSVQRVGEMNRRNTAGLPAAKLRLVNAIHRPEYPYGPDADTDLELLVEGQRIVERSYGSTDSMGGESVPAAYSEAYLRALGQLQIKDAYGDTTEMGGN